MIRSIKSKWGDANYFEVNMEKHCIRILNIISEAITYI